MLSNNLAAGLLFSMFWASASVAGKFGLLSVEPLVLFNMRFLFAGSVLLMYVYVYKSDRRPLSNEWKSLTIFGALNTTLYLGLFVIALQYITPGITSLAIALNPLFISIISAFWMRRKVLVTEWLGIALGISGVMIASWPLLQESKATTGGMALLALSMIAYSLGSVYYTAVKWKLSRTSINAWQVFIGGILLIPFTVMMHQQTNSFDLRFWITLLWLVFPVSIIAIQLWLRLLKTDAVKASFWLYLCPIFGFLYANFLMNEPITLFTGAGTAMVLSALYLGQRK